MLTRSTPSQAGRVDGWPNDQIYQHDCSRKSHQIFVGRLGQREGGGELWWVVDVKLFSLLLVIYYTGVSSLQSKACFSWTGTPTPRRHCWRVSWAFWSSWSSAPPRLDLAGQGNHFTVKEQKQQREDRVARNNGGSDWESHGLELCAVFGRN